VIEFLKDCIHELNDLYIKNVDSIYIKELEIIINADIISAKKGESPIVEIKNKISAEIKHVTLYLLRKFKWEGDCFEAVTFTTEVPTEKKTAFKEALKEAYTKKKTAFEEAQEEYIDAVYFPILMEYSKFLYEKMTDINTTINDPEYWKMRKEVSDTSLEDGNDSTNDIKHNETHNTNTNVEPPKIIQELIGELQLYPDPIDGKHKPIKNDRKFIRWLVENNYDERLTEDNYLTFINCTLKEETINRYFREARDEMK
jgi:hypothetical protein